MCLGVCVCVCVSTAAAITCNPFTASRCSRLPGDGVAWATQPGMLGDDEDEDEEEEEDEDEDQDADGGGGSHWQCYWTSSSPVLFF